MLRTTAAVHRIYDDERLIEEHHFGARGRRHDLGYVLEAELAHTHTHTGIPGISICFACRFNQVTVRSDHLALDSLG